MKRLFVLVVFLACARFASAQTLGILGHSESRTMFAYLRSNPQQLPEFSPANVHAVNHDSLACGDLLRLVPYDLLMVPPATNYFVVWLGDTDAEQLVPLTNFVTCLQQYVMVVHQAFPAAVIVLPTVPVDSYAAAGSIPGYLPLVNSYNAAIPGIIQQFSYVVPVDVTTLTRLPSGWGNPNLTYIDFQPAGWMCVMANFRTAFNELMAH